MNSVLMSLVLLTPLQDGFTEFSFCREGPREGDLVHCLRLNDAGEGALSIRSGGRETEEPVQLSESAAGRFRELLAETDYLENGSEYESRRNVANLGRKNLVVEGGWGRREAAFNYSARDDVNRLVAYLERIISQETLRMELEYALEFDRLGLPDRLERLEADLRADRIADPPALLETLRRIGSDGRVVNYARRAAEDLIEDIEDD